MRKLSEEQKEQINKLTAIWPLYHTLPEEFIHDGPDGEEVADIPSEQRTQFETECRESLKYKSTQDEDVQALEYALSNLPENVDIDRILDTLANAKIEAVGKQLEARTLKRLRELREDEQSVRNQLRAALIRAERYFNKYKNSFDSGTLEKIKVLLEDEFLASQINLSEPLKRIYTDHVLSEYELQILFYWPTDNLRLPNKKGGRPPKNWIPTTHENLRNLGIKSKETRIHLLVLIGLLPPS